MARLEFPLAQGWMRGLIIHFEDRHSSTRLKLDPSFLFVKQVHGRAIHACTAADLSRTTPLATADGLVADAHLLRATGARLLIQTADCLPLVFLEQNQARVALVHAGWRGLAQGIHTQVFSASGFRPERTLVWVGPSLNGENFEVGEDVWSQFPEVAGDSSIFRPRPDRPGHRHFFVWNYLDQCFGRLGVELIYQTQVDTFADEDFASYRRARKRGEESGARNYTWIGYSGKI